MPRPQRHVRGWPRGQVELVVWLAQMVAAMPSISGDQSRLRTGRMWRWCKMASPPRRVWANQNALLRAATGVEGPDAQAARDRIRAEASDSEAEDLVLFDDLLGIADPEAPLPKIDPDARRRRLTALVNAASLARETPLARRNVL